MLLGGIQECLARIERERFDEDDFEDDAAVSWRPSDFDEDPGPDPTPSGGRRRKSASPRGDIGFGAAAALREDSHAGGGMRYGAGEPRTDSPNFVPGDAAKRRSNPSSGRKKRRSVLDELDDECQGYDDEDDEDPIRVTPCGNCHRSLRIL